MKRIIVRAFLCVSLLVLFSGYVSAMPVDPPPSGKIWVEIDGNWGLVIAPPGDGPFIWRNNAWIIDPTPSPMGMEWIPGHWGDREWIPGHWEAVPTPGPGVNWVPGHWKGNTWVPGHWKGSPPHGKKWMPGHRGPRGRWIPGHWK